MLGILYDQAGEPTLMAKATEVVVFSFGNDSASNCQVTTQIPWARILRIGAKVRRPTYDILSANMSRSGYCSRTSRRSRLWEFVPSIASRCAGPLPVSSGSMAQISFPRLFL
jgi:hypothetical protein